MWQGASADFGSLEIGKWGDCVLIRAPTWEHLIYELGDPPIAAVIKKGRVVFSAPLPTQ